MLFNSFFSVRALGVHAQKKHTSEQRVNETFNQ